MKSVPSILFFKAMNPQPEGEPAPLSEWSKGIASACHDHSPDEDRLKAHTERLRGRIYPFRTKSGGLVSYRQPYRPSEKCLDKSTGKVVTVLSCEPVRVNEICVADLQELGYFASLMQDPCDMADQIKDKFKADWHKRHPGKEWAWRVVSEEEK